MRDFSVESKRIVRLLIGTSIYAVGILFFFSPAKLLSGGLNGYALLIVNAAALSGVEINMGLLFLIFNIPAIFLGLKRISRTFVYYSIISIAYQTILFTFVKIENPIFGNDLLANATFGGLMIGVGAGITLRAGASLGGMDIISQFIALKRQTSVGSINLINNAIILSISLIFFEVPVALYTLLGLVVSNVVVDRIHTGYKRVRLDIITPKGEEVKEKLLQEYIHGITIIDGVGAFTGLPKYNLIMVTQAHEVYDVERSVKSVDPEAFITMTPIKHLNGKFNQVIMK